MTLTPLNRRLIGAALFFGLNLTAVAQSATQTAPQTSISKAHQLFLQTSAQLLKDMNREKARAGYRQVVQLDDNFSPAWFNLGALAEAAGDWSEAKTDFDKYLAIAPSGPYANRAQRELNIVAERSIRPALTKAQQYDAAIGRARALMSARFYKEAVAEAAAAQSLDDSRWDAYAVVALCLAKQGKSAEANNFAKLAADRAPAEERAQIRAAVLRVQSKSH